MKYFFIGAIKAYQFFLSPFLKQIFGMQRMCRYNPSCSDYAIVVIKRHGIIQGSRMALKRLLSCQPFLRISHGKHI